MKESLEQMEKMLLVSQKRAGIDPEKVQKVAQCYLQIAKDNQLNYNELLQVFADIKESVLQSLNKVSISALPDITSELAKQ